MKTTNIKISTLGSSDDAEANQKTVELAEKIKSDLNVHVYAWENHIQCDIEDVDKISDYLLLNEIDHSSI